MLSACAYDVRVCQSLQAKLAFFHKIDGRIPEVMPWHPTSTNKINRKVCGCAVCGCGCGSFSHLHSNIGLEWRRVVGYFYDLKLNSKFDSLLPRLQSICLNATFALWLELLLLNKYNRAAHIIFLALSRDMYTARCCCWSYSFGIFQQCSFVIRPFSISLFFIIIIDYFGHGFYSFTFGCCRFLIFFSRVCV